MIIKKNNLVGFLQKERTSFELASHFSVSCEAIDRYLKDGRRQKMCGQTLMRYYEGGCFHYLYFAPDEHQGDIEESRNWSHRVAGSQPYLQIFLGNDTKGSKIILAPIPDAHFGSAEHKSSDFDNYLEWIRVTPRVYGIGIGDLLENAHKDSPGSAVFCQSIRPKEQVKLMTNKLRPLAHKILFILMGNHEARSVIKTDIDPTWIICDKLGIPYFSEPVYADIFYNGHLFKIYAHHGSGGAATKGGKLNRANRPFIFQEFIHASFMGHVHDVMTKAFPIMCRERIYDNRGRVVSGRIVERKRYSIIVGSFLGYFGGYAPFVGYPPPSSGIPKLAIYADGDYHVKS